MQKISTVNSHDAVESRGGHACPSYLKEDDDDGRQSLKRKAASSYLTTLSSRRREDLDHGGNTRHTPHRMGGSDRDWGRLHLVCIKEEQEQDG